MPAAIPVVAAVVGGAMQARGASKAASAKSKAAAEASAIVKDYTNRANEGFSPYTAAGTGALTNYQGLLGLGDPTAANAAYDAYKGSSGYQFGLQEGLKSVQNSAAGRGSLMSGQTLKALNNYGNDYASQHLGSYLDRLQGLQSQGLGAQGQVSGNFMNAAGMLSGNAKDAGAAKADGIIGRANAWANTANSIGGAMGGGGMGGGFSKFMK